MTPFVAISMLAAAVFALQNNLPSTTASVVSYGGEEVVEGGLKSNEFSAPVLPARSSASTRFSVGGGSDSGSGHSHYYTDPDFVPYFHPRFVYEEQDPSPMQMQIPHEFLPPASKRTTKGMLVDVVDFVTKGAGGRNQRLGQGMRSSGRRR